MLLVIGCSVIAGNQPEIPDPPLKEELIVWLDMQDQSSLEKNTPEKGLLSWKNKAVTHYVKSVEEKTTPKVVKEGINGRPALYFNGEGDNLILEKGIWAKTGRGFQMFAVHGSEENTGQNWQKILTASVDVTFPDGKKNKLQWSIDRPIEWATGKPISYKPDVFTSFRPADGRSYVMDNVIIGGAPNKQGIINNFKGYLGEILVYNRELNQTEKDKVFAYLKQKWEIKDQTLGNPTENISTIPGLKKLVPEKAELLLGAATHSGFWDGETARNTGPTGGITIFPEEYRETIRNQYSIITPANALKFSNIQRKPGVFDFREADQQYDWAIKNGIMIHGHTLVWHNAVPSWLLQGETWETPDELLTIMEQHIDQVIKHYEHDVLRYKKQTPIWDVANEVMIQPKDYKQGVDDWRTALRSSVWLNGGDNIADTDPNNKKSGIGPSFVEKGFIKTREALDKYGATNVALIYNDFGTEEINGKSDAIYDMIKDFLARGVPIDGIGFQMHINYFGFDYDSFAKNLARFAALRNGTFEIHITELDVAIPEQFTAEKLNKQKEVHKKIMEIALQNGAKSFTTWGVSDQFSSIPAMRNGWGAGLPFDEKYRPKPAYVGMREALLNHFHNGH